MNQQLIICNNKFLKNLLKDNSGQTRHIIDFIEIELLGLRKFKLYSYCTPITNTPILGKQYPSYLFQLITYYSSIELKNSLYQKASHCFDISNKIFVFDKNSILLKSLYNHISEYSGMLYNFH